MKPTITACVICCNLGNTTLEKYLNQCLESIQIANEIIIVTNTSTNNNIDINSNVNNIISKFNCSVFNIPKYETYADTWNHATINANSDFILFINANEKLITPNELINGTQFVKNNNYTIPNTNKKIGAITITINKNNQNTPSTRLIINNKNIQFDKTKSEWIDNNSFNKLQYYVVQSNIIITSNNDNPLQNIDLTAQIDPNKLLAICMIVKNEEDMLPGCLQSIQNIADEIVIVDTGSTDNTINIAKQFNAKIFHFKWNESFADARNQSIKYATAKWILYIDADERLTTNSQKQIRQLIQTAAEDTGAYFCTIESNHKMLDGSAEKHRGGYPRLFKNLTYPNIHFTGRVHEQISPSIVSMKKNLLRSDLIIEHLGYNLSEEKMNEKVQRNYKMLIAHVNEEPTNGYAWFQLGQTLGQMELFQKAEEAILFAIKCGDLKPPVYASAAATLSQFRGRERDFTNALYWAEESLKTVPNQLYGLSLKAHALLYAGRKKEAEPVFKQAIMFMKENQQMPRSGFDIDVSEEILLQGLEKCRR